MATSLSILEELFATEDMLKIDLASQCLSAMLDTIRLYGMVDLEFGATSRDYGYWPSSVKNTRNSTGEPSNIS